MAKYIHVEFWYACELILPATNYNWKVVGTLTNKCERIGSHWEKDPRTGRSYMYFENTDIKISIVELDRDNIFASLGSYNEFRKEQENLIESEAA